MSTSDNFQTFEKIIASVREEYLALFDQWYNALLEDALNDNGA